MSNALRYLGIARMSGNLEIGEDNAKTLVKAGRARLLLVASDSSDAAKRRADGYVFGFSTPLIEVPYTKAEISQEVGKPGCSMVAIRDLGLADGFVKALAAEYGDRFTELSEALDVKVRKAKARKGSGAKSGNGRKCE